MKKFSVRRPALKPIRRGQVITAPFLEGMRARVMDLDLGAVPPAQSNGAAPQYLREYQDATEAPSTSAPVGNIWIEVARTTVTERVYNPDDEDQWVDVDRYQTVTLQDAYGNAQTFVFAP